MNMTQIVSYNVRETYTCGSANFMVQDGTVWSLSFNDWLNAGACASDLGTVSVFFKQQILVSEDSKKVRNTTLIKDVLRCSISGLEDSPSTSSADFGVLYGDCVSKVGLELNFSENLTLGQKIRQPGNSTDVMDRFPILSVNEVSWNPNLRSFTWLALGMQCGLVAAPRMSFVPEQELADFYASL